jgi:hypothetical protein
MPIPLQLAELRPRLEAVGMIVVEEPDHLNVRLPFFSSVRVYSDGTRLRFESYFGVAARVKSTTLKLGGITVLAMLASRYGLAYAGVFALLAIVSGVYDSIRWQITESAITRVMMIAAMSSALEPSARPMLCYGTAQTLRSSAGVPTADDRVSVRERRDD